MLAHFSYRKKVFTVALFVFALAAVVGVMLYQKGVIAWPTNKADIVPKKTQKPAEKTSPVQPPVPAPSPAPIQQPATTTKSTTTTTPAGMTKIPPPPLPPEAKK